MNVYKDIKKMVFQMIGKENMFGYKTTLANQLCLIYCLSGHMHRTHRIHRSTRIVWFCLAYAVFTQLSFCIISYYMYGRKSGDILILIYIAFMWTLGSTELIIKPAILFAYTHEVEEMISMIDEIMAKKTRKYENEYDSTKIMITVALAFWIPLVPYILIHVVDMIFFYEEEKLYDYMYYSVPFFGLEHYASVEFYIMQVFNNMWQAAGCFTVLAGSRVFPTPWISVCHNEAQRIIAELKSLSEGIDINIDNYKSMEPNFKKVMQKSIDDINNLRRLIGTFRGYLEATAGIIFPIILFVSVVHALVFVSPTIPVMVRIREVAVFCATLQEVYVLCWVGATLETITEDLANTVYDTPWYWFKSVRTDVYVFLTEAQAPMKPVALSVYPLTLATFLRFCNVINSSVNLFRAYARKA